MFDCRITASRVRCVLSFEMLLDLWLRHKALLPLGRAPRRYLTGLCWIMASKSKERAFHPVLLKRALTLSGGYSCKQFVPQTREFHFIRGGGGVAPGPAEVKQCVRISHKETWLCELATGLPKYQRPLARVRIVRELTQLVAGDAAEADSKMAALAFDSEDSDEAETPKKGPAPPRQRNKKSRPAVAGHDICKVVEVSEQPAQRTKKISVCAALDTHRRLWLDVYAVPWLIQYMKEEKASGGLAPVVDEPQAMPATRIYWNFRDNNWIARAQAVDGHWLQASRGIKRKQKTSQLDFEDAKAAAFSELSEWVAKVDAGEITNKNMDSVE